MANTRVRFETSLGDILIELFDEQVPITVKNFLSYVGSGFYDGTIFHRVIPGFVVQGGGMLPGMDRKETEDPIVNEAAKGPRNSRGTLSMARTSDPHSATSQFFVSLVDNRSLDYSGPSAQGAGYCVFGRVVEGMEVVDAMATKPTTRRPPHADVPAEDIVLKKASLA
ncbi:MAG TPA: peptidylprolyl isomerase [Rectinemataceae bacterium]|nr:peptidylprolyl isomerase [Rectinemataceae bacterium]